MSIPIIDPKPPASTNMQFQRRTGHSLELGRVVAYVLPGTDFSILAHRDGVDVSGRFPRVSREGIEALRRVLSGALIHHGHLAQVPIGEIQTVLDEAVVSLMISNGAAIAPSIS